MIESKVLFRRKLKESQISVSISEESNRAIDPELESQVVDKWNQRLEEAERKGQEAYDGISFRLNTFSFDDFGKLHLSVSPIRFSVRSTLKKMPELHSKPEEYFIKGLSIGGFLITTDNKYIFGVKSGKSLSTTKTDFIGGVVEEISPEDGVGLMNVNRQEILEEVNIEPSSIYTMHIVGMVLSYTSDILLVTTTTLSLSSDEVYELFEERSDFELDNIVFVDEEDLEAYLDELGGYKPATKELLWM